MAHKTWSQRIIFTLLIIFFLLFLVIPIIGLLSQSFYRDHQFTFAVYKDIFMNDEITTSFFNSLKVASLAALITTILAFFMSYAMNMTQAHSLVKGYNKMMVLLPMLVPTITYGFILMYIFGNEGLIKAIFGHIPSEIYGKNGLLIGYVIYTLPAAYLIISDAFEYVNKRFYYVSQLLQDNPMRRFYHTLLRPLIVPIGNAFVLSFILSFTDFGIPASLGADYSMIATSLYQMILGSIPKFAEGAVIAVMMLTPAIIGFILLTILDRWNVKQESLNYTSLPKRPVHDVIINIIAVVISTLILLIFAVMFVVPFLKNYPYNNTFTLSHIINLFKDEILVHIYIQSLFVAICTAIFGVIISMASAIIAVRTRIKGRRTMNVVSLIANTVPGMILGLSYLVFFKNSSIKNTFLIIIISIIVHYYTTPFLLAKNALEKLNPSWDISSSLMKDKWYETVFKVVVPNMKKTIIEMMNYYFINAMVTISGVIFLVATATQLVATEINQLQHFNRFIDIFILSILICITNIVVRGLASFVLYSQRKREER
ncbi:ABC transporter permease subunit [Staphylococcus sp. NRL 18/288]|nr:MULTISPECIES: ABC transporter permease subunit [unclassified Staphylococcus]MCJ1657258.1 ABC transporter permease subunit [Staphylococcus sp. NRL 21/187]MCJ1662978.1 ABC transporter permease subunit [Staphylococcus sp. NRL 18/288]